MAPLSFPPAEMHTDLTEELRPAWSEGCMGSLDNPEEMTAEKRLGEITAALTAWRRRNCAVRPTAGPSASAKRSPDETAALHPSSQAV